MLIVMATLSTRLTQQVGAVDQHRVHPFADLHGRGTTRWSPLTASHNEAKSKAPLLLLLLGQCWLDRIDVAEDVVGRIDVVDNVRRLGICFKVGKHQFVDEFTIHKCRLLCTYLLSQY